jgi:hypothetical protein
MTGADDFLIGQTRADRKPSIFGVLTSAAFDALGRFFKAAGPRPSRYAK